MDHGVDVKNTKSDVRSCKCVGENKFKKFEKICINFNKKSFGPTFIGEKFANYMDLDSVDASNMNRYINRYIGDVDIHTACW